MDYRDTILDLELREVVGSFIESLSNYRILYFAFLDKDYLGEEIPYDYPQYIVITRDKVPGSIIDDIFFDLQDRFGWPYGHYFVNSFSRRNIMCLSDLESEIRVDGVYLDLKDIDNILDNNISLILRDNEYDLKDRMTKVFRNLRASMANIIDTLDVNGIKNTIGMFGSSEHAKQLRGTSIAVSNDFCRLRGEGKTNNTNTTAKVKGLLQPYIKGISKIPGKIHLYGRLNGCGKSQYIYNLMGFLYKNSYPFVMREVFYFHYSKYLEEASNKEEFPYFTMIGGGDDDEKAATMWLKNVTRELENKTGKRPVIIADELDFIIDEFKEYFIITADKDITKYSAHGHWLIQDIIKNDFIDCGYVKDSLKEELERINIFNEVDIKESVLDLVAENSILQLYSNKRCSIYHAKRLFSLCLLEGVKRYLLGEGLCITPEDVARWKDHYWNRFMPASGVIDDFHCEYIIFDGSNFYIDPYVTFSPSEIIMRNA